MVLQIVSVEMGAFFHLGRSSFVNYPFCPCFSNRSKQIYIVRSQKYRSFFIYFSRFPSERLVKKIVHSEKKRYFFFFKFEKIFCSVKKHSCVKKVVSKNRSFKKKRIFYSERHHHLQKKILFVQKNYFPSLNVFMYPAVFS